MKRILVLADTHVNDMSVLPERVREELKSVDMIVHAGDYTGTGLLEQLQASGDFRGVCGNMDPAAIKRELPDTDIIEVEGLRIGITHPVEGGSPVGLQSRVRAKFGDDTPDVIIYGHSHEPENIEHDKIRYINPGSATGAPPARYCSYGIIAIEHGEIRVEIVKL